ncbi:unnamed protein product [Nippostrongylus brasiliensis]|uniref:FLYWCH-type domain-containing protein n=1 Tax=Nippostrongylus brasiliensis TaxID=27835 RepID=A0A0N4XSQ7_NIPBR|nr:unnamed protein product [Nippostrongylus brasiliensis]
MQTPARIMNSSVTNKVGWLIDCTERCSLRGLTFCRRAARIHCHSPKTGQWLFSVQERHTCRDP